MLVAVVLDADPAHIERFRAYEDRVLELLAGHGARLLRRLRSEDGASELHLLEFPHEDALRAYMEDPGRVEAKELLGDAELSSRVLRVGDVAI